MLSRFHIGLSLVIGLGCLPAASVPAQSALSDRLSSDLRRGVDQVEFELRTEGGDPGGSVVSKASISTSELRITSRQEGTTLYRRESRWDSSDGSWLGYSSRQAGQVIRWPAANRGHLQIGRPQAGEVVFTASRMRIYPLAVQSGLLRAETRQEADRGLAWDQIPETRFAGDDPFADAEISPFFDRLVRQADRRNANPLNSQMIRLASLAGGGSPMLLSRLADSALGVVNSAGQSTDWMVTPAGNGYLRMLSYDRSSPLAMAVSAGGDLSMVAMSQHPRQLWRVAPGRVRNGFVLESVAYPGRCLTYANGGNLMLQPVAFAQTQLWAPLVAPLRPAFRPFWRTVSTQLTANPPLPPAEVELLNTHKYALVVLLAEGRDFGDVQQLRIEPNTAEVVQLERDAGATIVETVEIRSSNGFWDRREYVTEIPPQNFYDLSVYEEHLQSIAIDATGKSPNRIEDVNYVPKSVGWLPLPAGREMPDYLRIDLYAKALAANNPGAVRRLDPRQFEEKADENPLETILEKFQPPKRRKF